MSIREIKLIPYFNFLFYLFIYLFCGIGTELLHSTVNHIFALEIGSKHVLCTANVQTYVCTPNVLYAKIIVSWDSLVDAYMKFTGTCYVHIVLNT